MIPMLEEVQESIVKISYDYFIPFIRNWYNNANALLSISIAISGKINEITRALKCKIVKLLKDNIVVILDGCGFGDELLDTALKAWPVKEKTS